MGRRAAPRVHAGGFARPEAAARIQRWARRQQRWRRGEGVGASDGRASGPPRTSGVISSLRKNSSDLADSVLGRFYRGMSAKLPRRTRTAAAAAATTTTTTTTTTMATATATRRRRRRRRRRPIRRSRASTSAGSFASVRLLAAGLGRPRWWRRCAAARAPRRSRRRWLGCRSSACRCSELCSSETPHSPPSPPSARGCGAPRPPTCRAFVPPRGRRRRARTAASVREAAPPPCRSRPTAPSGPPSPRATRRRCAPRVVDATAAAAAAEAAAVVADAESSAEGASRVAGARRLCDGALRRCALAPAAAESGAKDERRRLVDAVAAGGPPRYASGEAGTPFRFGTGRRRARRRRGARELPRRPLRRRLRRGEEGLEVAREPRGRRTVADHAADAAVSLSTTSPPRCSRVRALPPRELPRVSLLTCRALLPLADALLPRRYSPRTRRTTRRSGDSSGGSARCRRRASRPSCAAACPPSRRRSAARCTPSSRSRRSASPRRRPTTSWASTPRCRRSTRTSRRRRTPPSAPTH